MQVKIIQGLIISALYLGHLEEGAHAPFGDATTLVDVKALAPGQAYSESPPTAFVASAQKRADKVHEEYHTTSKKLDSKLGTHTDATRRDRDELLQLGTRFRLFRRRVW